MHSMPGLIATGKGVEEYVTIGALEQSVPDDRVEICRGGIVWCKASRCPCSVYAFVFKTNERINAQPNKSIYSNRSVATRQSGSKNSEANHESSRSWSARRGSSNDSP